MEENELMKCYHKLEALQKALRIFSTSNLSNIRLKEALHNLDLETEDFLKGLKND